MNADDYETLMDCCRIYADDGKISFSPHSEKDQKQIEKIVKENDLADLDMESFMALTRQHNPLYLARRKVKQQKAAGFSKFTPKQVAQLPIEEKLGYMELLFPRGQTCSELMEVCKRNEENIKACLFNMDFPKSFWNDEKKLADRYVALIAASPEITDKLKNWSETSLEEKKNVIVKSAEVFEYVYGMVPDIVFFSPEEEKCRLRAAGMNEEAHINAAYYHQGKIHFNTERLQSSDNFFAMSVLLHEGMHYRQDSQSFNDALVDRIFNCDMNNVTFYENEINDKQAMTYKDLYTMLPGETHAHGVQKYAEEKLTEKTGIDRMNQVESEHETDIIHNKAFSMAKLTQYRSK